MPPSYVQRCRGPKPNKFALGNAPTRPTRIQVLTNEASFELLGFKTVIQQLQIRFLVGLFFSCAAYVLHHALRTETLIHTELAHAQPITVIMKLFKLAVRVVQYKDRIKLHLPSSCAVKHLLIKITEMLYQARPPSVWDTS